MPRGNGNILDDKSLATRRKILVESTKLFARQGYHRTTVTGMANAIGMTQGHSFTISPTRRRCCTRVAERLAPGVSGLPGGDGGARSG